MRILLVNSLYPPVGHGGAERSVAELADGLARDGATVAVVTLAPPGFMSFDAPEVTATGVRVHRWRPPGPWPFATRGAMGPARKLIWHLRECYRPSARSYVRAVLRDFAPDVVHTNNIAGFGVAILYDVSGYAWVHTLRDYYLLCPRTTRFRRGARCDRPCADCRTLVRARRLPSRSPDEVVGVSGSVLAAHREAGLWRQSTTSVVPNQPSVATIPSRRIAQIRTVGFLGRIEEAKGALVLLAAFAHSVLADLELVLVGPIDEAARAALDEWDGDPRVRHAGVLPATQLFSQVDLVVVPSLWEEPYGRVAAEAGTLGLPVLVSRRGGLPEAVARAEMSIVVEEPDSPAAWVLAIRDATTRWRDFDVGGGRTTTGPSGHEAYFGVYGRAARRRRTDRVVGRAGRIVDGRVAGDRNVEH